MKKTTNDYLDDVIQTVSLLKTQLEYAKTHPYTEKELNSVFNGYMFELERRFRIVLKEIREKELNNIFYS